MLKNLVKIDILLFLPAFFLSCFGLLMIYSITIESGSEIFYRQVAYFLVGLVAFFFISRVKFQTLLNFSPFFYLLTVGLLIITYLFGEEVRGSVRWINFGLFTIQPSEFAKPVLLLFLAYLSSVRPLFRLKNLLICVLVAAPATLLVFKEPDFGSGFVLLVSSVFTMFIAGINIAALFGLAFLVITSLPFLWVLMKDYQKVRVLSFLNPTSDPLGASYNVVQALIAFGSGQLLGKGLGRGTQSHLNFLPADRTDFILASTAEELGFVGIMLLLILFVFLVLRLVILSKREQSFASSVFIASFAFLIFMQFAINTGVNMALLPVTGITLPFGSFGGSSLVSFFLGLGIAQSCLNKKN